MFQIDREVFATPARLVTTPRIRILVLPDGICKISSKIALYVGGRSVSMAMVSLSAEEQSARLFRLAHLWVWHF